VEEAESKPPASIADLFSYTYKALPPSLAIELAETKAAAAETPR